MTLNFVQVETKTGIKEFELYHGDILNLPFSVDMICVSAFKNDYVPTPSSIIGQLYNKGINIQKLAEEPSIDFRENLGVWMTDNFQDQNYKNIICLEIRERSITFEEAMKNLFAFISILEIQGEENKTIAIPLLGAGDQGIDSEKVITEMLNGALEFLRYSRSLTKVFFVVFNEKEGSEFNEKMNTVLGRNKLITPTSNMATILKKDLISSIELAIDHKDGIRVFNNLKRVINSQFKTFEFGAISRKTVEFIVNELSPSSRNKPDLARKIESLNSLGVAKWIKSYMHLIRVFGNEAVHFTGDQIRTPQNVEEEDLEIGMYCMLRIVDFYLQEKSKEN